MPPPQDRFEVNLELVTVAGTEKNDASKPLPL